MGQRRRKVVNHSTQRASAIPNARSPTVRSLVRGTISWCVVANCRRRRESSSATHCRSLDKYSGAVWLRQRKTSMASRYLMRSGTRNQWRSRSNEETWSYLHEPFTKCAAAWGIDWSWSVRYAGTPASVALPWSSLDRISDVTSDRC